MTTRTMFLPVRNFQTGVRRLLPTPVPPPSSLHLELRVSVNLDGGKLHLYFTNFNRDLAFPSIANVCRLRIAVGLSNTCDFVNNEITDIFIPRYSCYRSSKIAFTLISPSKLE